MKKLHLHLWDFPRIYTRIKLGSAWIFYEECEICGKVRIKRW